MTSLSEGKEKRVIGPALCPDDVAPTGGIGPALPEHVFKSRLVTQSEEDTRGTLEDLTTIGPLLPGQELHDELRHFSETKIQSSSADSKPHTGALKRDAWMTELLPMSRQVVALKPRKFEQSVGSSHSSRDSSWFRTPTDSTKQAEDDVEDMQKRAEDEREHAMNRIHDMRMEAMATKTKEGKALTSLLDLHQKKLKDKEKKAAKKVAKKAKKESKKHKHKSKHHEHKSSQPTEPIRRPFDREKDLKMSYMSSAARNSLIERSKQLSSRFGHGSRQFL